MCSFCPDLDLGLCGLPPKTPELRGTPVGHRGTLAIAPAGNLRQGQRASQGDWWPLRLGACLDVDVTSDRVSRATVHTCAIQVLHRDAGPQRQEVAKSSLHSARQAMPHGIGVPPPGRGALSQHTQRCHMSWQCPCWYLSPAWETEHL